MTMFDMGKGDLVLCGRATSLVCTASFEYKAPWLLNIFRPLRFAMRQFEYLSATNE